MAARAPSLSRVVGRIITPLLVIMVILIARPTEGFLVRLVLRFESSFYPPNYWSPEPMMTPKTFAVSGAVRRQPQQIWQRKPQRKRQRSGKNRASALQLTMSDEESFGGDDNVDDEFVADTPATRRSASGTTRRSQNDDKVEELGTYRSDPRWQDRSKRWVILVDDEESIRKAVGRLLFEHGYQVTTCPDGYATLRVAKSRLGRRTIDEHDGDSGDSESISPQQQQLPDVIVSDVRMPSMDGLELLRRIRADDELVQVPVVLLTAKGMTQDRIDGYDTGADAYVTKPFDPDELLAIVDGVIDRREALSGGATDLEDLKRDLDEIKRLLLQQGGAGVGNGWIAKESASVFLTPDERQVLELLCEGLMTKEIAQRIFLSTRRVEQLLTGMFRKANVKNRTELVRWAISSGIVDV